MSATPRVLRAERKAQLVARAELDRARIILAVHEIRSIVVPDSRVDRATRYRPVAAMLVGVLGPSLGKMRVGRWLRVAGIALAAVRIARSWR